MMYLINVFKVSFGGGLMIDMATEGGDLDMVKFLVHLKIY